MIERISTYAGVAAHLSEALRGVPKVQALIYQGNFSKDQLGVVKELLKTGVQEGMETAVNLTAGCGGIIHDPEMAAEEYDIEVLLATNSVDDFHRGYFQAHQDLTGGK